MKSKQVIVVRKDLKNTEGHKVRTGKLISQGAHASMKAYKQAIRSDSAFKDWDEGIFTKITLAVKDQAELLAVALEASKAGLNVALIEDKGLTEFGGIPTLTCLAIGPHWDHQIDPVTGQLQPF